MDFKLKWPSYLFNEQLHNILKDEIQENYETFLIRQRNTHQKVVQTLYITSLY
jgi:hypothetical protein